MVALVVLLGQAWVRGDTAYDAKAYWSAARGDMYAHPGFGTALAYYYAPAFQQLLAPILDLPFPAFLGIWYVLLGAALVYLSRWWLLFTLAVVFVIEDMITGNIQVFMALAIVAGFRYPATWAFILLTKVTPGVGLLWFVVRREWRNLAIALGATAVIAGVSFVFAPSLWFDWVATLRANAGVDAAWPYFPFPLLVRLPAAAVVVTIGSLRGWRWSVPVAATLALPALWPVNMTLLVGVIPLIRRQATPVVVAGPEAQRAGAPASG